MASIKSNQIMISLATASWITFRSIAVHSILYNSLVIFIADSTSTRFCARRIRWWYVVPFSKKMVHPRQSRSKFLEVEPNPKSDGLLALVQRKRFLWEDVTRSEKACTDHQSEVHPADPTLDSTPLLPDDLKDWLRSCLGFAIQLLPPRWILLSELCRIKWELACIEKADLDKNEKPFGTWLWEIERNPNADDKTACSPPKEDDVDSPEPDIVEKYVDTELHRAL